jgi:two-component system, OmpR family, response regulator RpaB
MAITSGCFTTVLFLGKRSIALKTKPLDETDPVTGPSPQAQKHERILIVDDEANIRRILETRFKMLSYETLTAADGEEAVMLFNKFHPDLVVLDIMMPKLDGYGVTKEIRKQHDTPIIILTALGDVAERVQGLELGADDYVVKPFSPKELEARVKCILRRVQGKAQPTASTPATKESQNVMVIGNIKIDTNKRQVFKKNDRIRLTGMEFSLLELLVTNNGRPYSRGEILQHVWSYPADHRIDTRVVDVHISRLRAKLENDISNPELILTARGIGYMFQKLDG